MKTNRIISIVCLMILCNTVLFAQEETETNKKDEKEKERLYRAEHEEFYRHSITLAITHSFISQGVRDNDRDWLSAPSWGLNYNYHFNERWALGWHNDLIIEEFVVEDRRNDTEDLERSFPFSTLLVGTIKTNKHWGFSLGGGAEWEKNENFGMVRFGVEYGIDVPQRKMEIIFAFNYDMLIEAYDSFNIGIGIGKLF